MPIHDWTRVGAGPFHDFHQDFTIEMRRVLNARLLPEGYSAMAQQRVLGYEPDIIGYDGETSFDPPSGGAVVAVVDVPPKLREVASIPELVYAEKANRIVVETDEGRVVAIIEVVSHGNKSSDIALGDFVGKIKDFILHRVNVLVVDLHPPTSRDPEGIHGVIWGELMGEPYAAPPGKPLTVAAYNVGSRPRAYVGALAVGDELPEAPLFLDYGIYVPVPLEAIYATSFAASPLKVRLKLTKV